MTEFIDFFFQMWRILLLRLETIALEIGGFQVNYLSIIIALITVAFLITVLWKGARK